MLLLKMLTQDNLKILKNKRKNFQKKVSTKMDRWM